ncbi:DUF1120 domain-containing protein [Herbaspirillum sp.]|uniref:DUF1120 domain-containing protein n=1 Tax=Herbaspirillum sp. TaxID=1890675 RepID=UPI0031D476B2
MQYAIARSIFAVIAALAAGAALAAPTVELKVTGVIKPPACLPTFSGGGVVDYGVIPAASLSVGQYKTLDKKQLSFQVSCDAPVKMGVTFNDNRATSRVGGIVSAVSANPNERFNFGLGTVAGKNVGGYALTLEPALTTGDGAPVDNIYTTDNGRTWSAAVGLDHINLFAFAAKGDNKPVAVKQLSVMINVQAVLNKPEELPLTQDVPLDGSATIEVKYL